MLNWHYEQTLFLYTDLGRRGGPLKILQQKSWSKRIYLDLLQRILSLTSNSVVSKVGVGTLGSTENNSAAAEIKYCNLMFMLVNVFFRFFVYIL